jgi:tRNA 2-thiouridine synthesizing protein A
LVDQLGRGNRVSQHADEIVELDVSALRCPLPLLHAKRALRELADGAALRVKTGDPASLRDFASFARIAGHTLIVEPGEGEVHSLLLIKGKAPAAPEGEQGT